MHSIAFQNDWIMPWREWMKPQQQCRLQAHIHCIRYTDAVKCSGKNIFIAPSNRYVYSALIHWVKPPNFHIALGCSGQISVKGHLFQSDCIKAHRCHGFPHRTTIFWSLQTTFWSPQILRNHTSSRKSRARSLAAAHLCSSTNSQSVYSNWELIP